MIERLRDWAPELYAVGAVFSVGVVEADADAAGYYEPAPYLLIVVGMMLATALARKAPGTSLAHGLAGQRALGRSAGCR